MSATQYLIEAQTRHQIQVQRLGGGIIKDVMPILVQMRADIMSRVAGATEFQLSRLAVLLSEIDRIIAAANGELQLQLALELEEFSKYEAEFQSRMLGGVVTVETVVPAAAQLASAVTTTPAELVSGKKVVRLTVADMVNKFTDAKRREVRDAISAGIIEGQTNQQIAKSIRSKLGVRATNELRATVRTATNHAASVARQSVFAANADIIESLKWISTLDVRTSDVCISRDSKVYPVDDAPHPPAHYGCRSSIVPIVREEYRIPGLEGERPAVGSDGAEVVSSRTTYSGFLRAQSKEFQNDVLGPTRAKLFRSGELTLDKFVDDDGRTLTLSELRGRYGLDIGL